MADKNPKMPQQGNYKSSTAWITALGQWDKDVKARKRAIALKGISGYGDPKADLRESQPSRKVGATKPSLRLLAAQIEKEQKAEAAAKKKKALSGIKGYGSGKPKPDYREFSRGRRAGR